MRKMISTVLASACAALTLANTASATLQINVVDDRVQNADRTTLFSQMNDISMTQIRVTVL